MKKIIPVTILLVMLFSFSAVFAAEPVPPVPANASYEMDAAVKKMEATAKGFRGYVTKEARGIRHEMANNNAATTSVANTVNELVSKINTLMEMSGLTALLIVSIGVIVIVVVWLFFYLSRRHANGHHQAIINGHAAVIRGITGHEENQPAVTTAQIFQAVTDLGTTVNKRFDTVDQGIVAIRTLDPKPFEFEVAGHKVTYQSPAEGIAEGYYLLLHVPKDMAGDVATYDRAHETNRGVAIRECRKTMRLYFEGKFDAPEYALQKKLIEHLVGTKEISYRKIN